MITEFALVVPGFFVILLAGLTVADALSAYNRVQNVATTVGIMTSRLKTISNKDMVGIASAARGYLFPFPAQDLSILTAAVWVDDSGTPTITWCERWNRTSGKGGSCSGTVTVGGTKIGYWETGSNITIADLKIPSGLLINNTGFMVTKVKYDWKAPYGRLSPDQLGDFTMQDAFFYSPRGDVTLTPPTRDWTSPKPTSTYEMRG